MPETSQSGRPSLPSADELSAFATLAWGLVRRGGLTTKNLSRIGRLARDEFDRAGGVEAVRGAVAARYLDATARRGASGAAERHGAAGAATGTGRAAGANFAGAPVGADRTQGSPGAGFDGASLGAGPEGSLLGAPLGVGRAQGPVAIVGPGTSAPPAGAVLVAARPGPELDAALAGAAALIVETGNVSARHVRAARALGIPVVRLAGATGRFRDGSSVVVDGGQGTVNPTPD
jgi:phosphohistidine swiveling domain-containing protein